jgi:hypothetical protein
MGSDRDALINQAMFMFARLNGFIDSAKGAPANGVNGNGRAPARAAAGGAPPVLAPVRENRNPPPSQKLDDDPVRREVAERVLETAAELERLIKKGQPAEDSVPDQQSDDMGAVDVEDASADAGPALYLMAEGGELDRIAKDRFVIGRGKHCDFVINSGKVSREHAVVVRDGGEISARRTAPGSTSSASSAARSKTTTSTSSAARR